jgi:hypothetical protein
MKAHTIAIVTPAQRGSRSGNRISAERYARLFCALGQRVRVLDAWDHKPADVLVVLNATRSARSLLAARVQYPKLAIILVLTGTDVYGRRARGRGFERVIEAADCIVGLQAHTVDQLAPRRRARALDSAVLRRPQVGMARARARACVLGARPFAARKGPAARSFGGALAA